jgi:hypothetical protein
MTPSFAHDFSEGLNSSEPHQPAGKPNGASNAPAAATPPKPRQAKEAMPASARLTDFYAYMPSHTYIYVPTREMWPAASVNARVTWPVGEDGKTIAASKWLDIHRAVEQATWHPGRPEIITDMVALMSGWVEHQGARVFNLYLPPPVQPGDPNLAQRWIDHVRAIYPDDADHIIKWLAHRVQHPGIKCNHALVLGGEQGIGKDTILEPVTTALGKWNCQEISPIQMLGRFNGWLKAVLVRVSEARDLGEVDRYAFYEHAKAVIVTPPDVLRVDEKNLREHYVVNVLGLVITTNHKTDGLYLPADDRRHYVAWSDRRAADYKEGYWRALYEWYAAGGTGHVGAYLRALDLSDFDPKAPPRKTAAFWAIVQAGEAPESSELRDVLEHLGNPPAVTVDQLAAGAYDLKLAELHDELRDRKNRRATPHKLERVGMVQVRNPDATDGAFKVCGRRKIVYAQRELPLPDQIRAARRVG